MIRQKGSLSLISVAVVGRSMIGISVDCGHNTEIVTTDRATEIPYSGGVFSPTTEIPDTDGVVPVDTRKRFLSTT